MQKATRKYPQFVQVQPETDEKVLEIQIVLMKRLGRNVSRREAVETAIKAYPTTAQ
jgi:hypothetical protein